jgi:hypothetical protein
MKLSQDSYRLGVGLWCLMPLSTIFSYIVAVSIIGGGNQLIVHLLKKDENIKQNESEE